MIVMKISLLNVDLFVEINATLRQLFLLTVLETVANELWNFYLEFLFLDSLRSNVA